MGTGMYIIRDDGKLIEMSEQPYDSEDLLQGLLAQYPNLLAGEQINDASPRRWLLVTREASLPADESGVARWSVDHVFLDQDGIPTLIEVKRSSDTRIRREVVGQMLDYAANAVLYWPVEAMRTTFESRCTVAKAEPSNVLYEALGSEDSESFWARVRTNLQAGKVRLVFVADLIPPELQRIVEFLNGQMNPAEVLAIEIRQYLGEGLRTLVPRVLGQTATAAKAKGLTAASGRRQWDEASFFADLSARHPATEVATARTLYAWAIQHTNRLWWGRGKQDGSCYAMLGSQEAPRWLVAIWSSGHVEIPFQYMYNGPFADMEKRRHLLDRLNAIPGIALEPRRITGSPYIPLARFTDEAALRELFAVLEWAEQEIRAGEDASAQHEPY